jgi:uncharacterized protein
MQKIYQRLIETMQPGKILAVQIGLSRTAVMVETGNEIRCGMAATLSNPDFEHHIRPSVQNAGNLHKMKPMDLAALVDSDSLTEVSVGLATINALLPLPQHHWEILNAEDYITQYGAGKKVAVVGHFPFVGWIKDKVEKLWVLELSPREGDFPAEAAPEILPQADLIAITATTLINKTFQGLVELCRPDAIVILLGPSTPLSPVLFDFGVDILSGTIVTRPEKAFQGAAQGISLRQLRNADLVNLVTLKKEGSHGN